MSDEIKNWIQTTLEVTFKPTTLEIIDDSHLHVGHPGNTGGKHFRITIAADAFNNKTLVAQHQLVYQALKEKLGQDIHALQLNTSTPSKK